MWRTVVREDRAEYNAETGLCGLTCWEDGRVLLWIPLSLLLDVLYVFGIHFFPGVVTGIALEKMDGCG